MDKTIIEMLKEAGLDNLINSSWCQECGGAEMQKLKALIAIAVSYKEKQRAKLPRVLPDISEDKDIDMAVDAGFWYLGNGEWLATTHDTIKKFAALIREENNA